MCLFTVLDEKIDTTLVVSVFSYNIFQGME